MRDGDLVPLGRVIGGKGLRRRSTGESQIAAKFIAQLNVMTNP